jgi:hypothetical protein
MKELVHKPKSLESSIAGENGRSVSLAPGSSDEGLVHKVKSLEFAISGEKGPFDLFALFSTDEELEDKWDLVVAATWIDEDDKKALDYLATKLQKATQFIDRDGIKQHGAMVITFVDRECRVPELSR